MQERHSNRRLYFEELAVTSENYFIPYIQSYKRIEPGAHVLEIGCGDGGNLLPFAKRGCETVGVDLDGEKIKTATAFFEESGMKGRFIASDIFQIKELEHDFDLIICHDVFEHIGAKARFLSDLRKYVKPDGIVFMAFPAWQMPFGGHQQICRSKLVSHWPFVHLLPVPIYKFILESAGESEGCVRELLEIKETRTPIELFERLAREARIRVARKEFYFINPHYEVKFGLKARKLNPLIGKIPYVRNFFTTSCFYLLEMA